MTKYIDLNSDLGEGYGPWQMGDDARMLGLVSSANVACGGHASDPDTMHATLGEAASNGVCVGAHPGYADALGFGRRVIPMATAQITHMVAAQIGALSGVAQLTSARVAYVKPHGALANLAARDAEVSNAILDGVGALPVLAISGTVLEQQAKARGHQVYSEIFADRAYQANGELVPRSEEGAVIHDPAVAADRLIVFLESGEMPVLGGGAIALEAHSICVHGDTPAAVEMASQIRDRLTAQGVEIRSFIQG